VFIIDTGSTIGATVTNPQMLTGLKPSKTTLRMQTNAGTKDLNLVGNVTGFGEAWYDPDMLTNIFSFSKMADKYRVVYDSAQEDAILVHTDDGVIKFSRTPEGLYAYKPSDKYKSQVEVAKVKPVPAEDAEETQNAGDRVPETEWNYSTMSTHSDWIAGVDDNDIDDDDDTDHINPQEVDELLTEQSKWETEQPDPDAVEPEPEQVPMEEVRDDESDAYTTGVSVTRYDPSNGMAQLRESVQSISEFNPYIARFHVDDLMGNHADPKVKATRGKVHEFLGMKSTRGKADLFTKTLEGPAFEKFEALIMGG
jgi:hypothetical protein